MHRPSLCVIFHPDTHASQPTAALFSGADPTYNAGGVPIAKGLLNVSGVAPVRYVLRCVLRCAECAVCCSLCAQCVLC